MTKWHTYILRQKNGKLKAGVTKDIFEQLVKPEPLVWQKPARTKREATMEKSRLLLLSEEEKESLLPWHTEDPDLRKANPLLGYYLNVTPPSINGMGREDYREWLASLHNGARGPLVRRYAWAIPTEEAVRTIVEYGPIVEMGAGTGYWASLIKMAGGDVIAYDNRPPKKGMTMEDWNIWHSDSSFSDVFTADPTVLSQHSNRTLFLCWPPPDSSMATECLAEWEGDTLIFIGDRKVTADSSFFELLDGHFSLTRVVAIPQWSGVDDRMTVWRRLD